MRLGSRWLSSVLLAAAVAGLVAASVPTALPIVSVVAGLGTGIAFRSPLAGLAAVVICIGAGVAGVARIDALGPGKLADFSGKQLLIEGRFETQPRLGAHGSSATAALTQPAVGEVLVQISADDVPRWLAAGAAFSANARLRPIAGRPGGFYRSLERRGVHFTTRVVDLTPLSRRRKPLDQLRSRAAAASAAGLNGDVAALAKGITLGDDSAMTESANREFKRSGLSHLTAVSGANVLLLVLLLYWALGAVGIQITMRFWLTVAAVIGYAVICGGSASVVRAAAMGVCSLVAGFAGRASSRLHALTFAAVVLMLLDPWAYLDPGAQLSFAAVVGIFLLAARIRSRLPVLPAPFGEALAVTLAATAATAPILAWHFDEVSLTAIPANVLAVLAVAPATWMGFIAATVGQVWIGAAVLINALAQYPLGFVLDIAHVFASPDWATLQASPIGAAAVVLFPVVAFAYMPQSWLGLKVIPVVVAIAALLGFGVAANSAADRVPHHSIAVLDVGQGDAILLRGEPGCDVLVDAGPPEGQAAKLLRRAGVKSLSALVITHAARDHHGGAAEVAESLRLENLIDGGGSSGDELLEKARSAAARDGADHAVLQSGLKMSCPGIEMRAIWPPESAAQMSQADANLSAGVFLARVGSTTVLLTSDAESEILLRLDLPQIDVLKVSHHGSADPGLPRLLEKITPRVAVVSSGKNSYGHPNRQTIADLKSATVVRETVREGNIVVAASRPSP